MSLLRREPDCISNDEGCNRRVWQPLKRLGKCSVCSVKLIKGAGYLCDSCGERAYCSSSCQFKDWNTHHKICGITDRIELRSYYAYLAWLSAHAHSAFFPKHFALQYPIANDPNSEVSLVLVPEGGRAKMVDVDDCKGAVQWSTSLSTKYKTAQNLHQWYTQAHSFRDAERLLQRIMYGQNVLTTLTAIAYMILTEIYTTTSNEAKNERRIRLQYNTSPIADFGIAKGSIDVQSQDCLAFKKLSDGTIVRGQDPKDHYWLWFRTIRGEEVVLDTSMYPFNDDTAVELKGSIPTHYSQDYDFVPAFFEERRVIRNAEGAQIRATHRESFRASVLHSVELAETVPHSHRHSYINPSDVNQFAKFMSRVAGREISTEEARETCTLVHEFFHPLIQHNLEMKAWASAPAVPRLISHYEPTGGEVSQASICQERISAFGELQKNTRRGGRRRPQAAGRPLIGGMGRMIAVAIWRDGTCLVIGGI